MAEDPWAKLEAGLRKGTRIVATIFVAATAMYFAVYYWYSSVDPTFSVWWAVGYLVVALTTLSATLWYQANRVNPRILAFVQSLSNRLRQAAYVPYGVKMRGLVLAFDNGLVMNAQQNSLAFQLFLAADGTVLRPTVEELPALLRTYRGANRRGVVSSRKGDAWLKAELAGVLALLGSRWGVVILFEKAAAGATDPSEGKWQSVSVFSTPKWVERAESVRNALDGIEKLLEESRTGLALR